MNSSREMSDIAENREGFRSRESATSGQEEMMNLELLGHIDLPRNLKPGGFDHAAVHCGSGRLYVAHTANDALDIIDGVQDRYLYSIENLMGVAGALVSDEQNLVFTSNRGENTVGNFVVITIPDFALTPQEKALGGARVLAATQFVVTTNVLLAVELPRFAFAHQISIDLVDINAVFIPLVFSPGRFGFTNSSGEAYNPTLTLSKLVQPSARS